MKKGFALALTLWIVAMMSLVTALYLSYGKKTVRKTMALERKLKAILEVESTIELLKYYGATGNILSTTIMNNGLKQLLPTLPIQIFTDGRELKWNNQTIIVQDMAGLIGSADSLALANYLISTANTSKDKKVIIKESINDWLDRNGVFSLNGAEQSFYTNKGFSYSPRNENYISSLDELFLIRGIVDTNVNKKQLKSHLLLSSYPLRNILTMDFDLLQSIYTFSQVEIAQLKKARKESSHTFLRLFYEFRPRELNNELTGVSTSRVMKITILYHDKDVREKVSFLISFRLSEFSVSEVLEYNN